jgi:hypothetical protein
LTLAALALVLGSAAVHALWNALLADADDTYGTTAVMLVSGVVLFAPVAALTWDVDGEAIPYVLASGTLELVYFGLLATAYARADLAFVYPIAPRLAPVIVLASRSSRSGVAISGLQAAGVLVVAAGVLARGAASRGGGGADLLLAIVVGACIAGYTLVRQARPRARRPRSRTSSSCCSSPRSRTPRSSVPRRCARRLSGAPCSRSGVFFAYVLAAGPRCRGLRPLRLRRCARRAWSWRDRCRGVGAGRACRRPGCAGAPAWS